MRKPIIAGNWKMYKTYAEAVEFVKEVADKVPSLDKVDSVICAQATALKAMVDLEGKNLKIGAQNMHFEDQGAFTGELSASMLTSIGVTYVILGHSERRTYFNDTDEDINKQLKKALASGLKPIVCVGEHLAERESEATESWIAGQLDKDFEGISQEDATNVVVAYEPIWAIGTGKTATPEIAEETCKFIRTHLASIYDKQTADAIRIQYGGSVKLKNIDDLMAQPDIDGALIGGASLVAEDFVKLTEAAL